MGDHRASIRRSGKDPLDPIRIKRLRERGLTYRQIGITIAKEDGRMMPYTDAGVSNALRQFRLGNRDEDGERFDWRPATNKTDERKRVSLGTGIGMILFRAIR